MVRQSDGFFGKTISVSVANFWAEVSIQESATLRLVPNALSDPNDFGSLADLHGISRKEGYQGGLILLQVDGMDGWMGRWVGWVNGLDGSMAWIQAVP